MQTSPAIDMLRHACTLLATRRRLTAHNAVLQMRWPRNFGILPIWNDCLQDHHACPNCPTRESFVPRLTSKISCQEPNPWCDHRLTKGSSSLFFCAKAVVAFEAGKLPETFVSAPILKGTLVDGLPKSIGRSDRSCRSGHLGDFIFVA